jgi:formate hydrogenlyase subunit 4
VFFQGCLMVVGMIVPPMLAFVAAPLLLGVINRTKALFAGRVGPPLLQPYYDLARLLRKGAVYSTTTTWVFRAGPMVGLAALVVAAAIVPFGGNSAPLVFDGDIVLLAYLLGLARLATVLAALDTGSAFEGMGASREVWYSALAEPVLFLGIGALARETDTLSLFDIQAGLSGRGGLSLTQALVAAALLVVFLCENARIPVDDPNTHLELTMIHEVMVLDHSGPDLTFILYGAALKLWLLGALMVGMLLPPWTGLFFVDLPLALAGMGALAVGVGVIESTIARLRLVTVPQLLVGAGTFSVLALLLEFSRR